MTQPPEPALLRWAGCALRFAVTLIVASVILALLLDLPGTGCS